MKAFFKKHAVLVDLIVVITLMLLLGGWAVSSPAEAADLIPATASDSVPLFEILSALVGGEQAAQWLGVVGLVCYLITHIVAWLPPRWVAKLPVLLIKFIEYLAGNYRGTKNELDNTVKRTR